MIKQAVILAGGYGTRLGRLTQYSPKAMVVINGSPFIEWQLSLLKESGFQKIHLCIGHFGDQIIEHVRDGTRFDLQITYSSDGNELLGTGGALRNASPHLDDSFAIIYGDSYLDVNYFEISNAFETARKKALMTIYRNGNRKHKNNIELENGFVKQYDKLAESGQFDFIDYGLLFFRKENLLTLPANKKVDLSELLVDLIDKKQVVAFEVSRPFHEIGSLEGISELQEYLAAQGKVI